MMERISSSTGYPAPLFDNQEEENMDGPKALESPPLGSVSEPDRRRLLRSPPIVAEGTDGAMELAWRREGLVAAFAVLRLMPVLLLTSFDSKSDTGAAGSVEA